MNQEQQDALRKPFPKEQIGKLKMSYGELDFVSHAFVTERLLEVDPQWTWEPVGFDEHGLPKFDDNGGLWIKLTVCGVTRYGYGEPQGSDKFDMKKGAIGNSLRNAAMRFGIGLDLWQKETELPAQKISGGTASAGFLKMVERIALANSLVELTELVPVIKEAKFNAGEAEKLRNLFNEKKASLS